MTRSRVLVVGATGQLGGVIARKLIRVRRQGPRARSQSRGARAAGRRRRRSRRVDLRDVPKLTEACRGVDQIVATANNNMGKGPTSPTRIDLSGYQNLCAAARNTGVRRLIYVSYRGVAQDAPVDIFRVKWYIEDAIRRSGVPYVMLRPTAFMDVWIDQLLAKGIREKGVATIFGDGNSVANYIAVDDVAEFAVKILEREIVNEVVEAGGPSNVSQNHLAHARRAPPEVVRASAGTCRSRRCVCSPPVVRPFNEVAARLMTLGLYAATESQAVSGMAGIRGSVWRRAADRRDLRRSDAAIANAGVTRQRAGATAAIYSMRVASEG